MVLSYNFFFFFFFSFCFSSSPHAYVHTHARRDIFEEMCGEYFLKIQQALSSALAKSSKCPTILIFHPNS